MSYTYIYLVKINILTEAANEMKYNEFKIVEKRRNPAQNPKETEETIIAKLEKISAGSDNFYISYTAIDKIGVNPRSSYNTPVGIYSYPLTDDILTGIIDGGLSKGVPFAGDSPYIHLFSAKDPSKGLIIDDYAKKSLESDRKRLFDYMSTQNSKISDVVFNKIIKQSVTGARSHSPAAYIWNLTRMLSSIIASPNELKKFQIDIAVGDQVKMKDSGEIATVLKVEDDDLDEISYQIIALGQTEEENAEYVDGNDVRLHKKKSSATGGSADEPFKFKDNNADEVAGLKFKVGDLARVSNPKATPQWTVTGFDINNDIVNLKNNEQTAHMSFKRFYKANPNYAPSANESTILENTSNRNPSFIWSMLLNRVLGYNFVADYYGEGLIHPSEPVQAVFFQTSYFDVVEQFTNPSSTKNPHKINQEKGKITRKAKIRDRNAATLAKKREAHKEETAKKFMAAFNKAKDSGQISNSELKSLTDLHIMLPGNNDSNKFVQSLVALGVKVVES